ALNAIDIPSLQGLAQSTLAATIVSGKLSAQAKLRTGFAPGHFQLHAEPGGLTLDGFEVRAPNESQDVLGWKHFGVKLRQFDLGSRQAIVQEVSSDGLHVMVLREHGGQLNLASLLRTEPVNNQAARAAAGPQHHERRPRRRESTAARRAAARRTRVAQAKAKPVTPSAAGGWQYKVESIALDNTDATIEDQSQSHPLAMQIAALNLKLKDVTSDLAKPFAIQLEGRVNKKGVFKIAGEAAVDPLKARLRIDTRRVELASLDPFITSQLNAKITRAELNMNGEASAELRRGKIEAGYRGGITLGNVRILDKLTGESFLRWYALSLDRIDARYGAGEPRVRIGEIALSSFYARIILNANGRLNLRDVVSKPGEAPVSLTRERSATTNPAAPAPAPQSTPTPAATPPAGAPPAAAATPAPIPADIGIGGIKLQEGQINYTDDFIKPNYSADLTEVDGKVGAFGTRTTTPADVALSGKVNGDAPITITGAINPLAPMAAVDIKANAQGVELTPLAPYSTKYTGYPITDGTLTVDVHYLLANQQLTAQNHIVIDQLTFGDRAVNSSAANLPVRLAVALLKDRQGRIDLQIPISGSLSDPQFSIGGVIWHAVLNLVMKAVTSPFSLLASAIGGKAGQNLSYIEFSAGYATLTKAAQAKLETVAKALQQKTSLKLEITGRVDPKLDIPGLRAAMLEAAIKRAKSGKKDLTPAQIEQVKITPDQYDKYLWRVYKAADFEKPRDLMGLTKSLPPDQLKQAILAHTKVSDDDLRHLADARATAVAQALSGKIDAARVSTLAPKLNVDGVGAGSPTTIADMTLR
ncbi:MAG TPA: DUF748 domain-containing protein, partial [Candidatus Binataceae bacterium]|nr:DUF748 domain-containing protein [Candidatus Binataceae bacterium]